MITYIYNLEKTTGVSTMSNKRFEMVTFASDFKNRDGYESMRFTDTSGSISSADCLTWMSWGAYTSSLVVGGTYTEDIDSVTMTALYIFTFKS